MRLRRVKPERPCDGYLTLGELYTRAMSLPDDEEYLVAALLMD